MILCLGRSKSSYCLPAVSASAVEPSHDSVKAFKQYGDFNKWDTVFMYFISIDNPANFFE
uniref:Uncharacterized protein n=1 Tax=Arion vulgaris TaxID=1028688 RepID=A0A0B7B276_9EUPU